MSHQEFPDRPHIHRPVFHTMGVAGNTVHHLMIQQDFRNFFCLWPESSENTPLIHLREHAKHSPLKQPVRAVLYAVVSFRMCKKRNLSQIKNPRQLVTYRFRLRVKRNLHQVKPRIIQ